MRSLVPNRYRVAAPRKSSQVIRWSVAPKRPEAVHFSAPSSIFTSGQRVALERPGIVAISGPQKWTHWNNSVLKRILFLVRI